MTQTTDVPLATAFPHPCTGITHGKRFWVDPTQLPATDRAGHTVRPPLGIGGAQCVGLSTYLFLSQSPTARQLARDTCAPCLARPQCLKYALQTGPRTGIWAGLDEGEREVIATLMQDICDFRENEQHEEAELCQNRLWEMLREGGHMT